MIIKNAITFLVTIIILTLIPYTSIVHTSEENKISVVTSIHTLESIVREIGGPYVDVCHLIPENVEPHTFQLTPDVIRKAVNAKLLVLTGHFQFENDLIEVLGDANERMILRLEDNMYYGGQPIKILNILDKGYNLHAYWLLPENAITVASVIRDALSTIDPKHSNYYTWSFLQFKSKVESLARRYRDIAEKYGIREAKAVIAFPSEQYIVEPLGLQIVGVISVGHGVTITGHELLKIEDILRTSKNPIIIASDIAFKMKVGDFVEKLAESVNAKIVHVKVLEDDLEYTELLSYNLGAIAQAFIEDVNERCTDIVNATPLVILTLIFMGLAIVEGVMLWKRAM